MIALSYVVRYNPRVIIGVGQGGMITALMRFPLLLEAACRARVATAREMTDPERRALTAALADYRTEFTEDPDRATKLLKTGESPTPKDFAPVEVAAWTMLCNMLLNLDEVISKD